MPYRSWDAPSLAPTTSSYIRILGIACPEGTVPYYVDLNGNVDTLANAPKDVVEHLRSKLFSLYVTNEAGCYAPNGYSKNAYHATYSPRRTPTIHTREHNDIALEKLVLKHHVYLSRTKSMLLTSAALVAASLLLLLLMSMRK